MPATSVWDTIRKGSVSAGTSVTSVEGQDTNPYCVLLRVLGISQTLKVQVLREGQLMPISQTLKVQALLEGQLMHISQTLKVRAIMEDQLIHIILHKPHAEGYMPYSPSLL